MLCKGFALCSFLFSFWVKGKKLKFNSEKWEDYFLTLSERRLEKYVILIYFISAFISSLISYFMLDFANFYYSIEISLLLFMGGIIITSLKWHKKGRDYLIKRYREIPETILEKRKSENL